MGFLDRLRRPLPSRTPEETDRLLLDQLLAHGADLTQPRHVLHFLYFPGEVGARAAAREIERLTYAVTVTAPGDDIPDWSVCAEGERLVDATTVATTRAWFEQVAGDTGGSYDGWEAATQP